MKCSKLDQERVIPPDTADKSETSTLLKLVYQQLERAESSLIMDKSAWEEINSLFDVDGPIAKCLQDLPKSPGHNALSVGEALSVLKWQLLWFLVQISAPDKIRELCDELGAVHQATADLAANLRARKSIGRVLDLDPVLSALDEFVRVVEVSRKRWGSKRGPKTAREFVREVIQVVEIYIGSRVGMGRKRGAPADVVRQIIEIIDPTIGKSTIEEALKARSRETSGSAPKGRGEIKRQKR